METFFQKPREEWTELEKRAFEEVQNICNRHDGDAEARYGAWEAMVWLSSQLKNEFLLNEFVSNLEKQKEQKHVETHIEKIVDEMGKGIRRKWASDFVRWLDKNRYEGKMCISNAECRDIEDAFVMADWDKLRRYYHKYVQPPVEWSEEDEAIFDKARDAVYYQDCNDKQDVLYALKGLCDLISKKRKVIPIYQKWKPSEEQMEALAYAIQILDDGLSPKAAKAGEELEGIREHFKKL